MHEDCGHNNNKAGECVQCYKINICLKFAPGIQIVGSVKIIKDWDTTKLPLSPKKKDKQTKKSCTGNCRGKKKSYKLKK